MTPPSGSANRLLALLPRPAYLRLAPHLHPVQLKIKHILYKTRATIDAVYFPTSGIVSAMAVMQDGASIEVATIGNEGVVGLSAFIGGDTSPYEVMVQIAGNALRLAASLCKEECDRGGALRDVLVNYNTAYASQVAYAVACNGLHKIEQRACRWLLMTSDRVGSEVLPLTHEFLAIMLGVRRSSVTEVLKLLQERNLLHTNRGSIEITDRAGVEATACECYQAVKSEFVRLFGE